MSERKRRKWFSQKDGTTFIQDVQDASEELKNFFDALPLKIKKYLNEATWLVDAIQKVDDLIEDGTPLDVAITTVLNQTITEVDNEIYAMVKEALDKLLVFLDVAEEVGGLEGAYKNQLVSETLVNFSNLNALEADTATQVAVYAYKS